MGTYRAFLLCVHFPLRRLGPFNIQEIHMATQKETTEAASTTKDWLKKVDQSTIADLRKKYPKAIWLVGGVVLLSLIL